MLPRRAETLPRCSWVLLRLSCTRVRSVGPRLSISASIASSRTLTRERTSGRPVLADSPTYVLSLPPPPRPIMSTAHNVRPPNLCRIILWHRFFFLLSMRQQGAAGSTHPTCASTAPQHIPTPRPNRFVSLHLHLNVSHYRRPPLSTPLPTLSYTDGPY
jgi:hypothetical protein